jgi:LPXTG-site transpeptidase (sortase) family protein
MSKSKKPKNELKLLLSNNLKYTFLTLGLILILISVAGRAYSFTKLSFFIPGAADQKEVSKAPEALKLISIPEQNIELPLENTKINKGIWQISENGASLLNSSSFPKTEGKYIIYAHNTLDKFGKITNLKRGSRIYLAGKNGEILKFEVTSTQVVNPNQVEVLTEKSADTLILYTCTGLLDSKRFIVKASPIV